MEIHCPICGKTSKQMRFIGNFCESCTIKKILRQLPEEAKIKTCRVCNKIWSNGAYVPESNQTVSVAIKQALGQKNCQIDVLDSRENKEEVSFEYMLDGQKVSFKRQIAIKRIPETCRQCSMEQSGYYEALIQLRSDEKTAKKLLDSLEDFVKENESFISKIVEMRNGYDVYVSSKKTANKFFSFHKLKPIKSFTLYGMRRGKKLYRNIYSLKI